LFHNLIGNETRDLDYHRLLSKMCSSFKFSYCTDYQDTEHPPLFFKKEQIVTKDDNGKRVLSSSHYATRNFNLVAGHEFDESYAMISHGINSSNEKNDKLNEFNRTHGTHLVLNSPSSMFIYKGSIESQINDVYEEDILVDSGIMLRREAFGFLLKTYIEMPMPENVSSYNPYTLLEKNDRV
jgi:hypothetical protein